MRCRSGSVYIVSKSYCKYGGRTLNLLYMAHISHLQKMLLERLFLMEGGYVLDFSNNTFQRFIADSVKVNIYDGKYATFGDSKANRLRAFWDLEEDRIVGKLTSDLLNYIKTKAMLGSREIAACMDNHGLYDECVSLANALNGADTKLKEGQEELDFLTQEVEILSISTLSIDSKIAAILEQRMLEVRKCLKSEASLSVIFLCGSILEGVFVGVANMNPKEFNQTKVTPKNRDTGKPRPFREWTLNDFIEVAYEIGFIGLDVRRYSHSLRDFRNFIHPNEQLTHGFNPDQHTAKISWQVLKAAIHDISKKLQAINDAAAKIAS